MAPKLPPPVASAGHVSIQLLLWLFRYASTALYQLPNDWPLACQVAGSKLDQLLPVGAQVRLLELLFQPVPLARWEIQLTTLLHQLL